MYVVHAEAASESEQARATGSSSPADFVHKLSRPCSRAPGHADPPANAGKMAILLEERLPFPLRRMAGSLEGSPFTLFVAGGLTKNSTLLSTAEFRS